MKKTKNSLFIISLIPFYSYSSISYDSSTNTYTNNDLLTSTGKSSNTSAWTLNDSSIDGSTVVNGSSGEITTESTGILIGGNHTVTIVNDGTITTTIADGGSWNDAGIRSEGIIPELTNNGTISSWKFGVFVNAGKTEKITNNGTINSTKNVGVMVTGSVGTLYNASNGIISGETGVQLDSHGNVSNIINDGVINTISNNSMSAGIYLNTGGNTSINTITNNNLISSNNMGILNYGNINSINNNGDINTSSASISIFGGLSEFNNSGNVIADIRQAVYFDKNSADIEKTINNTGLLLAKNGHTVEINGTNKITIKNEGSIISESTTKNAINVGKNNTDTLIYNSGLINGGAVGINSLSQNSVNINNDGEITSLGTGIKIQSTTANAIVNNTGTIKGDLSSINLSSNSTSVYNYGSLLGDVSIGNSSVLYVLGDNSIIEGDISGGTSSLFSIGSSDITSSFDAKNVSNVSIDKIIVENGSSLKLYDSNSWTISSADADAFLNKGTITIYGGDVTLTSNMTNNGVIALNGTDSYKTLTIAGDYIGNEGSLILNSKLGDDTSETDKLSITGDASGTTYVTINNLGGQGSQTIEGIKIVDVEGTSTSDAFVKNGRIVAGAYDYNVVKGNLSKTDTESWYLSSYVTPVTPEPTPTPTPTPQEHIIRPEAGSYIGNLYAANTMFNLQLHDRLGETQYTDLLTGEKKVTSMWLRYQYTHNKFKSGNGQLDTKNNWNVTQLGGDIAQWSSNELNRLHIGLMAGYGRSTNDTDSRITSYSSSGKVDGYSLGIYGTWYDNNIDKTGFYIDGWALWNHFDAEVKGQYIDKQKYKLKGLTASLESGYTFKLGNSERYDYWLQPKAQMTYMGVDADNNTESNGTKVKNDADNWQSRLGVRLSMSTNDILNNESTSDSQLFIETNWLHNTELFTVKMNDNRISQEGTRNIGEIRTGVEANILKNTNVWFNLAYQRGDDDYHSVGAMLGAKYSF